MPAYELWLAGVVSNVILLYMNLFKCPFSQYLDQTLSVYLFWSDAETSRLVQLIGFIPVWKIWDSEFPLLLWQIWALSLAVGRTSVQFHQILQSHTFVIVICMMRGLLKCKHCHHCCLGYSSLHLLSLLGQTLFLPYWIQTAAHQLLTPMPRSTIALHCQCC